MKVEALMTPDPVTVWPAATLDRAMDLLDEHDVRHLPVVSEDGALVGVVSDRDVLEATGWLSPRQREMVEAPAWTVDDVMPERVATIGAGATVAEALGLFVQRRIGCLAVVEGDALVGVVTEMDVLRAYADACRRGDVAPADDPRMLEHMTPAPTTIAGDASGDEAAALMRAEHVRHLPVVRSGRLVGIVSDRDVRRVSGRGQLEVTLVRDLMSPDPATARPDERLSSVALILYDERISALPVVTDDRLIGIATTVDAMVPCATALQRL